MSAFANDPLSGRRHAAHGGTDRAPGAGSPVLVDLFRLASDAEHEYDYVLQYSGQLCDTTAPYEYNESQWSALGTDNGYQHLMGGQARLAAPSRLTWLQGTVSIAGSAPPPTASSSSPSSAARTRPSTCGANPR